MTREPSHSVHVAQRPVPIPTDETLPFWNAALAGELFLPRCSRCNVLFYPPPPRCPRCLCHQMDWTKLTGRGRIVGVTTVHLPTIPGITPPFTVVEVQLDEQVGLIVTALLAPDEPASAAIGDVAAIAFTRADARNVSYPQFRIVSGEAR